MQAPANPEFNNIHSLPGLSLGQWMITAGQSSRLLEYAAAALCLEVGHQAQEGLRGAVGQVCIDVAQTTGEARMSRSEHYPPLTAQDPDTGEARGVTMAFTLKGNSHYQLPCQCYA